MQYNTIQYNTMQYNFIANWQMHQKYVAGPSALSHTLKPVLEIK